MKKSISFVNLSKKNIKITLWTILFFVFVIFSSNYVFATDIKTDSISSLFMSIVDLISSIWLIFPIIAWKLLTNDLVYWTSLHIDILLWKIWNFSRTIANYIIGFLFVYMIIRYIVVFSDKDASLIKTWLPKIVISAILINMSWFLLAILIDLSTILIAAFGSLTSHFWIKTPKLTFPEQMEITIQKCDPKANSACNKWSLITDIKWKNWVELKDLQKYETTVSWPLMFLGLSIIEIPTTKNNLLNEAYDFKEKKFKHNGDAIKAIVKLFIFVIFLIPLIILTIVNVVRIFWIWIYVAFSPLLFLDWTFWKKKLAETNKAFDFKNVIWLIFSPALVVLWFSISIIFIIWIADALNASEWSNTYTENVKKKLLLDKSDWSILEIDFWEAQDTWKTWSKYIWWFIWYLIVSLLTIVIVWTILKLSFKSSDITKNISEKMFSFSEDLFKTIPVPTPLWMASVWSIQKLWQTINEIPSNLVTKQTERLDKFFNRVSDISDKERDNILEWLKNYMSFNDNLDKLLNELNKFKWKKEIETSTNAKLLIDELVKAIKKNGALSRIQTELDKATDYEEKLNIILKEQLDIKGKLRASNFN